MVGEWINKSSQLSCSLGRKLFYKEISLIFQKCFQNNTYPIRSQDILCFFIFVVGLNFKWIPTTTVLLKQGHCFWGSGSWLLTRWNWWGTRLFHKFKFLDVKKRSQIPFSNNNKIQIHKHSICQYRASKKKLILIPQIIHF